MGLCSRNGKEPDTWKMRFAAAQDTLLLVADAIVYRLNWRTGQCEVLVDQRYEECLKGCRLLTAKFDSAMQPIDIALLGQYS